MKLFVFGSINKTNIWAGIGARRWAVSSVDDANMKARITRATKNVRIGCFGIIYCSESKSLTTPFIFTSAPDFHARETSIWPEEWRMPFHIHPLGTPHKEWDAADAARRLPFNAESGTNNIARVFKAVGTAVFAPIEIGEDDWAMILQQLADGLPN